MKISEINPYIRYARSNETTIPYEYISASDCRIFYCSCGETVLQVNEQNIKLKKGSLICWRGGIPYRTVSQSKDLNLLALNFDFTYMHATIHSPINPQKVDNSGIMTTLETFSFSDAEKLNGCLFLDNMFSVEEKFLEIINEYNNMLLFHEGRCSALLKDILLTAVRHTEFSNTPKNIEIAENILNYIRENYNKKISNSDISAHFSYHPNYINKIVVNYTGMSLHRYLIQCRINAAKSYLINTEMTVSEVAEKVGIPDIKHFSKCFKKITHHTPSEYMMR